MSEAEKRLVELAAAERLMNANGLDDETIIAVIGGLARQFNKEQEKQ